MEISVVIPNLNGEELLPPLLDSLKGSLERRIIREVIVADDGSTDSSPSLVRKMGDGFRLIERPSGAWQGFGPNVNRGVKQSKGEVVAVLNSDLRIGNDIFTPLREWLADPSVGAVMPAVRGGPWEMESAIRLWVRRGLPWVLPWERPPMSPFTSTHFSQLCLHGACFLIRREVWEKVGGFDERFRPAYFEDIDLGMRLNLSGLSVVLDPRISVTHLHSKTVDRELGKGKEHFMQRNQLLLVRKHRRYLGLDNPRSRGWLILRGLRQLIRLNGSSSLAYFIAALEA